MTQFWFSAIKNQFIFPPNQSKIRPLDEDFESWRFVQPEKQTLGFSALFPRLSQRCASLFFFFISFFLGCFCTMSKLIIIIIAMVVVAAVLVS